VLRAIGGGSLRKLKKPRVAPAVNAQPKLVENKLLSPISSTTSPNCYPPNSVRFGIVAWRICAACPYDEMLRIARAMGFLALVTR